MHRVKKTQLVDIQAVIYYYIVNGKGSVQELPTLARAWIDCERQLSRMRMIPEPKPIEVSLPAKALQINSADDGWEGDALPPVVCDTQEPGA